MHIVDSLTGAALALALSSGAYYLSEHTVASLRDLARDHAAGDSEVFLRKAARLEAKRPMMLLLGGVFAACVLYWGFKG